MSVDLTGARVGLVASLRSVCDLAIYTTPPEEPEGDDDAAGAEAYPLVYVLPAEPYVDFPEGTPFGWGVMHLNVSVVSGSGTSDVEAAQIDAMLGQLLVILLELDDWQVGEVQQAGRVVIENVAHLACPITISREIKLL